MPPFTHKQTQEHVERKSPNLFVFFVVVAVVVSEKLFFFIYPRRTFFQHRNCNVRFSSRTRSSSWLSNVNSLIIFMIKTIRFLRIATNSQRVIRPCSLSLAELEEMVS